LIIRKYLQKIQKDFTAEKRTHMHMQTGWGGEEEREMKAYTVITKIQNHNMKN
jgi:hypothetical protein